MGSRVLVPVLFHRAALPRSTQRKAIPIAGSIESRTARTDRLALAPGQRCLFSDCRFVVKSPGPLNARPSMEDMPSVWKPTERNRLGTQPLLLRADTPCRSAFRGERRRAQDIPGAPHMLRNRRSDGVPRSTRLRSTKGGRPCPRTANCELLHAGQTASCALPAPKDATRRVTLLLYLCIPEITDPDNRGRPPLIVPPLWRGT